MHFIQGIFAVCVRQNSAKEKDRIAREQADKHREKQRIMYQLKVDVDKLMVLN